MGKLLGSFPDYDPDQPFAFIGVYSMSYTIGIFEGYEDGEHVNYEPTLNKIRYNAKIVKAFVIG